ncbi:16S rRNA (cytosine(1402)-N(4))-methyltransferase RsmH [Mesorhizobium sp. LHD-90]|uniref:16S rRNA (cytosine(1402)-N(4))-methyltransferase RsmH n=1 Tax=Mesorhizobium sp. LHD-90 TaxID=3071414 RepID=UPI0027E0A1C0|nr:16S rRNA (cytosine(1402)-N(4))-methyltransferase RsmH [Mesorhizobium sp. LHD-90]MDQ6433459.1 16S rRNA (cytosine(1402)-N(4))-methyltransferase RsmH [Mesorhizobium sp. LHD-90]
MMAGHGEDGLAVGGPARHIPVLLDEVMAALSPEAGQVIVDGTFGAGGYTKAILASGASVIGIDRDPDAIAKGRALEAASEGRLRLVQAPFSSLDEHAEQVDGVVLDIGISSMQVDQAERGFSFRSDGPLDMRMAQAGVSAADVVNRYKAGDLARIFGLLGEERHAGRIARMIEKRRAEKPFSRTTELAQAIADLVGFPPREKIHPATRVFQALRIHVNDELGELARALCSAERALKPGGRLVVVTFHSLEDRIVKRFIADRSTDPAGSRHLPQKQAIVPTFRKLGGVVAPSEAEVDRNPRARSAKLRAAVRTDAPARTGDGDLFGLPKLPDIRMTAER